MDHKELGRVARRSPHDAGESERLPADLERNHNRGSLGEVSVPVDGSSFGDAVIGCQGGQDGVERGDRHRFS
jgi:hypothetical protein